MGNKEIPKNKAEWRPVLYFSFLSIINYKTYEP